MGTVLLLTLKNEKKMLKMFAHSDVAPRGAGWWLKKAALVVISALAIYAVVTLAACAPTPSQSIEKIALSPIREREGTQKLAVEAGLKSQAISQLGAIGTAQAENANPCGGLFPPAVCYGFGNVGGSYVTPYNGGMPVVDYSRMPVPASQGVGAYKSPSPPPRNR